MATIHHPVKVGLVYSITISVISIILTLIFYMTNIYAALWTGYFVNLVLFLGVLLAVWHYYRQQGERASAKALFMVGFRITLIVTVVLTIFTVILHLIVQANPGSTLMASDRGSMEVDMPRNFWIFLISNVLFSNGIVGLLAALMGAAYFKRNQKSAGGD
ncbi:hypothetical protein [uncultured Chitinophaga sp.]|jgi:hypothetical protein|uniref:hypothetical protein n=1 Tax=uncultured Chitinophaga sp. TaxID=339340 RepID=UPI00262BB27E|nr:hypothetical protein [uncultured Chitinophaga sp.]